MTMTRIVRDGMEADAVACAAIYAPYVRDTAITFETEPPDAAEFARRIAAATARHAWLVLEDDGRVTGYAYGGPFKERAAYRYACEVSVYLEHGLRRSGGGRALYSALLAAPRRARLPHGGGRDSAAQRRQRWPAPRAWGSRRSARSGASAGSTAAGTTWPGCSATSAWGTPRDRAVPRRRQWTDDNAVDRPHDPVGRRRNDHAVRALLRSHRRRRARGALRPHRPRPSRRLHHVEPQLRAHGRVRPTPERAARPAPAASACTALRARSPGPPVARRPPAPTPACPGSARARGRA